MFFRELDPDEHSRHRDRASRGNLHNRCKSSSTQEGLGHRSDGRPLAQNALLFASGLALWILYGFLQTDFVIILANGISLLILSVILYLKLSQRPTHSAHQ